jgi:RNA polymerase sigma-70 factor (ECF subfamily)
MNNTHGLDYHLFSMCYDKYCDRIIKFLQNIVKCRDTAEDLSHEVFLKIIEKKIRLDPNNQKISSFLLRIAKNVALDYLRKKKLEFDRCKRSHIEEQILDRKFYETLEDSYLHGEIISTLHDTIGKYPDDLQSIIIERSINRKSYTAISRERNISGKHIREIETDLYKRLRPMLKFYFY